MDQDKKQQQEESEADMDPLLMMEEILEKLKLLEYEALFLKQKGHKPLSRSYFAIKSTGEQFNYFSSLSIWLLSLCGVQLTGDRKYEDPLTTANSILTEIKNLGVQIDVAPNKLRQGYGDAACLVLKKLTDLAFIRKKIAFKKVSVDKKKEKNDDDDDGGVVDIDEALQNFLDMEIDYGDNNKEEEANNKDDDDQKNDNNGNEILYSDIPDQEWKREVEKMSSKLKTDLKAHNVIGEWRGHIEQIKTFDTSFEKSIPNTRQTLEKLSEEIDKSLEKIQKKESMISKNFTAKTSDYKAKQKEFNDQYNQYNELTAKLAKLEKEYNYLDEKVEEANGKYEEIKKSVSDTSSLANIKQMIQKLNQENISYEIKIGILNHSLLKFKLNFTHYTQANHGDIDTSIFDEAI